MINIGFYVASAVALFATTMVITNTNPVHALLYLVVSLLAIAMVFFTLGAPFAGVLEVIIYAGAIMVLFVFVVMMLNLGQRTVEFEDIRRHVLWRQLHGLPRRDDRVVAERSSQDVE